MGRARSSLLVFPFRFAGGCAHHFGAIVFPRIDPIDDFQTHAIAALPNDKKTIDFLNE